MEKLIFILLLASPLSVVVFHFIKLKFNKIIIHEGYFTLPIIFNSISFMMLLFNYESLNKLEFSYIKIHSSLISLIFSFNNFNLLMCLIVLVISICVLIYSYKFISNENYQRKFRYSIFLNIFISSMVLFSLSDDLLSSFIFWEFLGLCSFFLIAYYNSDVKAIYSSTMAFWITRFGDLFFLMGLIIIYLGSQSLSISSINNFLINSNNYSDNLALFFILIGIFTKCAQYPFTIWLPRAMKGPTPVSALIHSATMVVAGIFLLFKLSSSIEFYPFIKDTIFYVGLITSLICSIYAFYENDLKGILAYSTLSHIGFMLIPIGNSAGEMGYFHLYSHSFFKSLLFLMAGYLILKFNETSINKLSGKLSFFTPYGIIFSIACLSLAGVYPLTGSFSKEYIIIDFINNRSLIDSLILIISVLFTCLYSSKLFFSIINFKRIGHDIFKKDIFYLLPMGILAFFSLTGFYTFSFFKEFTNINFKNISTIELISLQFFVIFFITINYFFRDKIRSYSEITINIAKSFIEIEYIYRHIYKKIFVQMGSFVGWFDRNIIDGFVNFLPYIMVNTSNYFQKIQDGFIRGYASKFLILIILSIILFGITFNV